MGIHNVNTYLKEVAPQAFREVDLACFAGMRIAVDAPYIIHTWVYQAAVEAVGRVDFRTQFLSIELVSDLVVKSAIRFITELRHRNISFIFIRDADVSPAAKSNTLEERQNERNQNEQKFSELVTRYLSADPLSADKNLLIELRKAYLKTSYLPGDSYKQIINRIYGLGIPQAQVKDGEDGERLAAALVREGYAAAVWTTDTDVLVHGASCQITGFVGGNSRFVKITTLPEILTHFGGSLDIFREFCIMCGCDYNKNIYRIGPAKSYKLLLQYGNIDAIGQTINVSVLNHQLCRQLFSPVVSNSIVRLDNLQLNFNVDQFRNCPYITEQMKTNLLPYIT